MSEMEKATETVKETAAETAKETAAEAVSEEQGPKKKKEKVFLLKK